MPPEAIGHDNFLLWMTLPLSGNITLRSSSLGGDIYKAEGHLLKVNPESDGYTVLKRKHVNAPNVSKYILDASGFSEAKLLKNERAEKTPFSLRMMMRYLLIDEARIIDEKSVILSHNRKVTAEDKSLLKFLLTGVDGSSVEQVRSGGELKAALNGKIELLTQMATGLQEHIDTTLDISDLPEILKDAEQERDAILDFFGLQKTALDESINNFRSLTESVRILESETSDLQAMHSRFLELLAVYKSDIDRLQGLEEGSFLVMHFAQLNCPLCGADREHQKHDHGLSQIEEQSLAIEAEINKIQLESIELEEAIESARCEIEANRDLLTNMKNKLTADEIGLKTAKIRSSDASTAFINSNNRIREIEGELRLRDQLSTLESQIDVLSETEIKTRQKAGDIDTGVELTESEAYELSKIIKEILLAWKFPHAEAVHFNQKDQDIVVNGKRRKDNGAGIRSLLHSAFKISVLVHSIRNDRPHPGFVILDSPLLAYREAEENDQYGELTNEEIEVKKAGVASAFYEHLNSLKGQAQFIVIENHKSDEEVVSPYPNVQFTRNPKLGRSGLF